ncbi:TonB-dependent siderophore receptor [Aquabacterium sp. A7-Y]|uniref:TonB-dependent siderophore receptor n=1 Tax=Aquabacterium sp. A7-Y TaxID=1349605 RepID=UPI00223CB7D2|nr:TonB-dependent siderophore receptor [Aquabacterium sp. A7-Y]MCW7537381.1 TonB-dependent siderophore receptor [Aquabacterium sp. A7-Y]
MTVSGQRARSFSSRSVQVGTFRDQDPLDVPLTNNAVTREVLDAQGARTLYEALRNTAGVTRSQLNGSTYDNISIRGILVENRGNHRLNGSLPVINLVEVPLENKERVEVLKGASSLYYGILPPSGIVNYVTKRATATPVTSLTTSVNNHGGADVHADIGRRFGTEDDMGLRVNVAGGRVENGIEDVTGERSMASLAWDWTVSPAVKLKFDLEHYRKNVSEPTAWLVPLPLPRVPDNTQNLGSEWQRYKAEATNALLRADISLSDSWLLTLEAGRARTVRDRRLSMFTLSDPASGTGTVTQAFADDQTFTNNNQRAELAGRFSTGSIAHELTAGITRNRRHDDWLNYPNGTISRQNIDHPVELPRQELPASNGSTDTKIVDRGLYVSDRVILSERWQVLAGLRHTDYRYDSVIVSPTNPPATRYKTRHTTPNYSVLFKANESLSFYVSYLKGLEETPQPTRPAYSNEGEFLPPAVSTQKELGVKARVARELLLQAAVFDIDRQQTTSVPSGPSTKALILAGRSRYRGLELSASGELSPSWALIASAQLLDAEITETRIANELDKTPENTPKHTFSLFAEHKVAAVPGWSVNAGVYHVGKRYVNNANTGRIGSYTTLSVGTRYATRFNDLPVTVQANLDNATDRDYWSTTGNGLLGTGLPRTLRVAAKFDF